MARLFAELLGSEVRRAVFVAPKPRELIETEVDLK